MMSSPLHTITYLSQQDAPALAGAKPVAGAPATEGVPGTAAPAQTPQPTGGMDGFLIMMILFIVVMLATTFWSQRKEKKRAQDLLGSLRKHDKVLTNAGMIGSIVEVKPDTVVLKVDETSNVRITFLKTHITQVIEKSTASEG